MQDVKTGYFSESNTGFLNPTDISKTIHSIIPAREGIDVSNTAEANFELSANWWDFSSARLIASLVTSVGDGTQIAAIADSATAAIAFKNLPLSRAIKEIVVYDAGGKEITSYNDCHFMQALVDHISKPLDMLPQSNASGFFKDTVIVSNSNLATARTSAGFIPRQLVSRESSAATNVPAVFEDRIHGGWFEQTKPIYGTFTIKFRFDMASLLELSYATATGKAFFKNMRLRINSFMPATATPVPSLQYCSFPDFKFSTRSVQKDTQIRLGSGGAPIKRIYLSLTNSDIKNDMVSFLGLDATTYLKNVSVNVNGINYPDVQGGYTLDSAPTKIGGVTVSDYNIMRMYHDFLEAHGASEDSASVTLMEWMDRYAIICIDCSRDRFANVKELEQGINQQVNLNLSFSSAANLEKVSARVWFSTMKKVLLDQFGTAVSISE